MQDLLRQHKNPHLRAFLIKLLFEIQYPRIKLKCWLFIFGLALSGNS